MIANGRGGGAAGRAAAKAALDSTVELTGCLIEHATLEKRGIRRAAESVVAALRSLSDRCERAQKNIVQLETDGGERRPGAASVCGRGPVVEGPGAGGREGAGHAMPEPKKESGFVRRARRAHHHSLSLPNPLKLKLKHCAQEEEQHTVTMRSAWKKVKLSELCNRGAVYQVVIDPGDGSPRLAGGGKEEEEVPEEDTKYAIAA